MPWRSPRPVHRPRELRRRVVVPARLRDGRSWSDTCILNISSRGMMIQTSRPLAQGSNVEVGRGDHVIRARVMWRDGARTGLKTDDRVPVEAIMTIGQATALQLTAAPTDRRREPRYEGESRLRGRAFELAGAIIFAIAVASAAMSMVQEAFARPIALVAAAIGG